MTVDVGETNDLSEKYPDQLNGMIKDYDDYAKSVGVIPPVGLEIQREADPANNDRD